MSDLQNAWKNEKVFQKQLEYNLKELDAYHGGYIIGVSDFVDLDIF